MRSNNVSSIPNNIVTVLATVTKGLKGNLVISPEEIAFGKFDDNDSRFYCIDNKSYYESLEDNLYDIEDGKLYYCFERTIDELKELYGENLTKNNLMNNYMSDVLDTYNIAIKDSNGKFTIHSVPYESIGKRSNDPIEEITSPSEKSEVKVSKVEVKKPAIITKDENSILNRVNLLEFEKYLKDRVIGNDKVLENVASKMLWNLSAKNPKLVENMLNLGPTGTGKTYTFELISEYLGVPLVIYNSSSLSTAGYQGQDTNDLLKKVYNEADGKIELANKAIVILDEIDKVKNTKLDIKEQAQNDLLALLGGSEIDVELNAHTGQTVTLNTKSMTFVGCGAFTSIFDAEKEINHNPIGFLTPEERKKIEEENAKKKLKTEISDEDLIKYGMMRELIGRFPNRNVYANLDAKGLKRVLKEAKDSILSLRLERYLEDFNTEVICTDPFIDGIVNLALKEDLGGRGLNKVCADLFERLDRRMLIEDHTEHKVLRLTKKNIENKDNFKFTVKKM